MKNTRKVSSHRSVLVHFHDDGEVCPQSFGKECPFGDIEGPLEPASPSFLSKLPNGFNFSNIVNPNHQNLNRLSFSGGSSGIGNGFGNGSNGGIGIADTQLAILVLVSLSLRPS